MRTQVIILSLLGAILGALARDIAFDEPEDKTVGQGFAVQTENQIGVDLDLNQMRRGGKKPSKGKGGKGKGKGGKGKGKGGKNKGKTPKKPEWVKPPKFICRHDPFCPITGCSDSECCIGKDLCCPCPIITNPPMDDLAYTYTPCVNGGCDVDFHCCGDLYGCLPGPPPGTCPECIVEAGVFIYAGHNAPGGAYIKTKGQAECESFCHFNSDCVGWTMHVSTNRCWLKTVFKGYLGKNENWISGTKACGYKSENYDKMEDFTNQVQAYLDSEIANLTSTNLAEFQSSSSECSFLTCGKPVIKALRFCNSDCQKQCTNSECQAECTIRCAKKILLLQGLEKCWPCIKKGCCILHYSCCDVDKDTLASPVIDLANNNPINNDLIVTGGDNKDYRLLDSSEIITSSGVCEPINPTPIPNLPNKITAGGIVWIKPENTKGYLVFCGGSQTFIPGSYSITTYGATNYCFSLEKGDIQWSTVALCGSNGCGDDHENDMNEARSWFSLTAVNDSPGEIYAVGGIDNVGNIHRSIEMYSFAANTWTTLPTKLPNPRFGHCAVLYSEGDKSYIIFIGGSSKVPYKQEWRPTNTVDRLDLGTGIFESMNGLPIGLWRPACTISNGYIYVSGGSSGSQRKAQKGVYRYSFGAGSWSQKPIGYLQYARWGAVMGTTVQSSPAQLTVAGGYNPSTDTYYSSVERSNDGGKSWKISNSRLNKKREYAGAAEVPPSTFTC